MSPPTLNRDEEEWCLQLLETQRLPLPKQDKRKARATQTEQLFRELFCENHQLGRE
jgi:hypothetical protein